jgi:hypothetical protein
MAEQRECLSEQKEKLWGHEPGWWSAIFAIVNVVALGFFFAGIKWLSDISDKSQNRRREAYDLQLQFMSEDSSIYKPALHGLVVLEPEGRDILIKNLEILKTGHCVFWPKARDIALHLKSSKMSESAILDSVEIALNSWKAPSCSGQSLQEDLEFSKILKNSQGACSAVLARPDVISGIGLLRFAVRLSAIKTVCTNSTDDPRFKTLQAEFWKRLSERIESEKVTLFEATSFNVNPSPGRSEESEQVDRYDTQQIILESRALFHTDDHWGELVLWKEIGKTSRWERVIFAQFMCDPGADNKKCDMQTKKILKKYVSSALRSTDERARFAAIAAVANLYWPEFMQDLKRIQMKDVNPIIRLKAEEVLDRVFALQ